MLSILVATYRPEINRQNLLGESVGENPLYGSFHESFLGFLDENETQSMIVNIGKWKAIVWSDDAIEAIYRAGGGHPMFSRLLASEACLEGAHKQVVLEDVNRVVDGISKNFRKHRIGNAFEESIWAVLRDDERQTLQSAASGQLDKVIKEQQDALVSLEHFGLLCSNASSVTVNGELLQVWLKRSMPWLR